MALSASRCLLLVGAALSVAIAGSAQVPARSSPATQPTDLALSCPQADAACVAPPVMREFRGVWVATVRNIDWPSRPGLPPALQKAELVALLDRAAAAGLNAVLFQVRPAADALYESKLEPWSEYLTGRQGRAPIPLWDPLAFAVTEAHARGLELHAWFNPYRAKDPSAKGPLASTHIARTHPALVKRYGTQLWMDPGEPAVQERTLAVILDVVKRYDIDGVHLDDYFYPYPERRSNGSTDFPDEPSWKRYLKANAGGNTLSRGDWRRENVNRLIETIHREIVRLKPWVKFGISPFQLWRPGYPASVTSGLDAYATLYADSRKWFRDGSVDYLSPQLYRRMDEERSYPLMLAWWASENVKQRHLWPGLYTSGIRTGNATEWRSGEIVAQVGATRAVAGATGTVHFSMEAFLRNRDSIATMLVRGPYTEPALVPASPWMMDGVPDAPVAWFVRTPDGVTMSLRNATAQAAVPRWWVAQFRTGARWDTRVLNGARQSWRLRDLLGVVSAPPEVVVVTAIDRIGNASAPAGFRLP